MNVLVQMCVLDIYGRGTLCKWMSKQEKKDTKESKENSKLIKKVYKIYHLELLEDKLGPVFGFFWKKIYFFN